MFCFQCEQTRKSKGCATRSAARQGRGRFRPAGPADPSDRRPRPISQAAGGARRADAAADSFIAYALFTTLTNVNFDRDRFFR